MVFLTLPPSPILQFNTLLKYKYKEKMLELHYGNVCHNMKREKFFNI